LGKNSVRQTHTRPLSVWQVFSINLFVVAAITGIALIQNGRPTPTLPPGAPNVVQTPISAAVVSGDGTAYPTRTVGLTSTAVPAATTARATPAATRTKNASAALATATVAIAAPARTQTPTALASLRPVVSITWPITEVLGHSTLEWPIVAYQFGAGPARLAFIGGIHGGYEWNSILLAYEAIDHFAAHPEQIPESVSLIIVPSANPDGQDRILNHVGRFTSAEVPTDTAAGRFNGNEVDLNRNWDQNWAPVGTWRNQEVSGGDAPFSEVETQILRDFLRTMDAVVLWHSARPGVYAAFCDDVYPPSQVLAVVYADAAQYPLYEGFDDYAVTGGAVDWLACAGVPAIAVELTNHTDTDGAQNRAAILAVIDAYSGAVGP